jgi:Zn-dependent protease
MTSIQKGSFRLFRFAGIDLFLHWSWFLVAAFEISGRGRTYSSLRWNALEYLALFFIVMLHEYGHALACRQVGGRADRIVLWPLGGVAYVRPPSRPGAVLWSIAAGPLVNLALLPVLSVLEIFSRSLMWAESMPNADALLHALWFINLVLLIFNLFPIYPLDGGQILRALLWFWVGRARSLMMATMVGFVGVGGLILVALWTRSVWFGVIAAFILINCWGGLRQAQALARRAKLPRRDGFACPSCKTAPPVGRVWTCDKCRGQPFDTFQTQGTCPHCWTQHAVTMCPDCGHRHPMSEWIVPVVAGAVDIVP